MKKSNRFISFACSLALATSAFSGMIVANAEEQNEISQGVVLEYNESESTATTAVIGINAVGFDSLKSFTVNLVSETEDVTITSAEYVPNNTGFQTTTNVDGEGVYRMVGSINTADEPSVSEDTLLGTVELTFDSEITKDVTIALAAGSLLSGTAEGQPAKIKYDNSENDTMDVSRVTISPNPVVSESPTVPAESEEPEESETPTATVEPTETPYATARPTARPTETPVATSEPVETPEPVEQGVMLSYNEEESTNTTAVIDLNAVGFDSLKSFTINLVSGTDNVAIASAEYVPHNTGFQTTTNVDGEGIYRMVGSINTADEPSVADDTLLGTVELTFASELTTNARIELAVGSLLSGTANGSPLKITYSGTGNDTMSGTFVTVLANPNAEEPSEPVVTEKPAFDNDGEIKLSDLITDAPATDDTLGNLVAVVVEATVGNDAAVYGEDFVAEYNDEELTEDEYFNLINGYADPITDVIDGLVFLVNDGVTVKASPAYQTTEQATDGTMTVVPGLGGEQTFTTATEAPEGEVTLTVEEPTHGSISISYKVGDKSYSYDTEDEGDIEVNIPEGTSVKFKASADRNYEFSRWGDDLSGTSTSKTVTVDEDMTVSARFTKVDDDDSSSSSSGSNNWNSGNANGPIAGGQGQVSGGMTGFQDLGSVPWAQTAINSLTSAGIINGRSSTIFDPNASVTRAEFAKMVCLTFGISEQTTGTQRFTDVGPSDWFYGYVQAAAATGIVNGVSDTAFDPNATIKRQEMAAMLYRAISAVGGLSGLPAGTAITFVDADQIADYAQTPVSTLSAAGVINGTTDNQFEPLATATRAQAACIIYQYLTAVQ